MARPSGPPPPGLASLPTELLQAIARHLPRDAYRDFSQVDRSCRAALADPIERAALDRRSVAPDCRARIAALSAAPPARLTRRIREATAFLQQHWGRLHATPENRVNRQLAHTLLETIVRQSGATPWQAPPGPPGMQEQALHTVAALQALATTVAAADDPAARAVRGRVHVLAVQMVMQAPPLERAECIRRLTLAVAGDSTVPEPSILICLATLLIACSVDRRTAARNAIRAAASRLDPAARKVVEDTLQRAFS